MKTDFLLSIHKMQILHLKKKKKVLCRSVCVYNSNLKNSIINESIKILIEKIFISFYSNVFY